MAGDFGWTGQWAAPRRVAGVGGLVLDWVAVQLPGNMPAPAACVATLTAAAASREPGLPATLGGAAVAHGPAYTVGISCVDAWPRARGRYVYAAARLQADRPVGLALRLGSYVGYRAWCDGTLVMQAVGGDAPLAVDDNRCILQLSPGPHALVVEVDREAWTTVFHARLSAPDGGDPADGTVMVGCVSNGAPPRAIPSAFETYGDLLNVPGDLALETVAGEQWDVWRDSFGAHYRALLALPPSASVAAVLEDRRSWRGLILERVVLRGGPAGPVPVWCLFPEDRRCLPAILAVHGHGAGKDDVIGFHAENDRVRTHNYTYGLEFARRGYAVFAPDLRTFGERADGGPERRPRDPCDNNFMKAMMLGRLPLALDLADLQSVLGYAQSRPEVDPARLGCVGLSLGGRMAMYLGALDHRIRATVSSGALNLLKERLTSSASCGSQLLPGLWRYGDTAEVYGLIAPRPLLLELGTQDGTSPEVYAAEAYRRIRHAYALAGAEDRLEIDVFVRDHRFSGRLAFDFIDRWLGAPHPCRAIP